MAALEAERNVGLLGDDDKRAAKLFAELESLRAVAAGHADKIKLLEAEVERERAANVVRRHKVLIDRFQKTLGEADEAAAKAAEHFAAGWEAISKAIDLRERARAAFAVRSSHARAAAEAVDGAALGAAAVIVLLEHYLYRLSAKPLLGGVPGARTRPHLGKSPSIEFTLMPHKIVPLVDKLKAASAFAVATLKAEIGTGGEAAAPEPEPAPTPLPPTPPVPGRDAGDITREVQAEAEARDAALAAMPAPPPAAATPIPATNDADERTPEQVAYSDLLQQVSEAANDTSDAGEQRYVALVAQVGAAEAAAKASLERTA